MKNTETVKLPISNLFYQNNILIIATHWGNTLVQRVNLDYIIIFFNPNHAFVAKL